jgi:hypothetical protein
VLSYLQTGFFTVFSIGRSCLGDNIEKALENLEEDPLLFNDLLNAPALLWFV